MVWAPPPQVANSQTFQIYSSFLAWLWQLGEGTCHKKLKVQATKILLGNPRNPFHPHALRFGCGSSEQVCAIREAAAHGLRTGSERPHGGFYDLSLSVQVPTFVRCPPQTTIVIPSIETLIHRIWALWTLIAGVYECLRQWL